MAPVEAMTTLRHVLPKIEPAAPERRHAAVDHGVRDSIPLSTQKIAQITGLSVTSVKTSTHRTRLVLRKRLGRTCRALRPIALRAAGNVTGPGGATS